MKIKSNVFEKLAHEATNFSIPKKSFTKKKAEGKSFPIVAIGASAGWLKAISLLND